MAVSEFRIRSRSCSVMHDSARFSSTYARASDG